MKVKEYAAVIMLKTGETALVIESNLDAPTRLMDKEGEGEKLDKLKLKQTAKKICLAIDPEIE